MVQYQPATTARLDLDLAAISDPTRRAILERLGEGEATISELAAPRGMSLTGLKKHVAVLEGAGLVSSEKRGRARHCRLGPRRLEEAAEWIERFRQGWTERLDRVEEIIEEKRGAAR